MTDDCVRRAWLTLGNASVELESWAGGWFCTSLDLGYPEVRDVTNNRPDQHGVDDRTLFYGKRVVTADVLAVANAGAQIDAVASQFAPYMNVTARPVLHWILDRPGAAERVLTLRPSQYGAVIKGADTRDIHMSWIAADPIVRDPVVQSGIAWSGSGVQGGRTYNLTFPRTYPVGAGGPGATTYNMHTYGDLPVWPLYRIYGPVTAPRVTTHNNDQSGDGSIRFRAGFQIDANDYVDVDSGAKSAYRADGTPVMASLDWTTTVWIQVNPYVPGTGQNVAVISMSGSSTSPITQVQVFWQDAYLT